MPTKDALIRVLEENRNRAVSGQELADTLHITRAAVWKAVRSLQEDGYHIEAMRNRGYRLSPDTDVLSAQGVALFLPEEYRDSPVTVLPTVDSTNSAAKRLAAGGAPHRTLVLADDVSKRLLTKDNTFLRVSMPLVDGAQIAAHLPFMGPRGADFILEAVEAYLKTLR